MTTNLADDYSYIKSRMEEIARERASAPAEHEMQTAVENYLGGDASEPEHLMPYLGFDIYAPHSLAKA